MIELMAVGIGGFIGSCLRYIFTKITGGIFTDFPIGTLLSNVIAGFLIGFIIGIDKQTDVFPKKAKLFLTTGMFGGLSTFSTFSIETIDLFKSGKYLVSFGNVALNIGLSFGGVIFGLAAARILLRALK